MSENAITRRSFLAGSAGAVALTAAAGYMGFDAWEEEARQFLAERFAWLTAYRMRLLALEDDARFYIGLVDVILAIRAQQTTADAVVA